MISASIFGHDSRLRAGKRSLSIPIRAHGFARGRGGTETEKAGLGLTLGRFVSQEGEHRANAAVEVVLL